MPDTKEKPVKIYSVQAFRLLLALPLLAVFQSTPARAVAEGDTTTVTVTGFLVGAPECTVNGNNRIDVDFGEEVYIREIDGITYKRLPLAYTLSCTSLVYTKLKLAITGRPAAFGSGLLGTDKAGLGIRIFHGDTILPAGDGIAEYINFTWNGSGSGPALYAVPVAEDIATLTPGAFSGSGTLVLEYQ